MNELVDEIRNKLAAVNSVQLQGANGVASYVWDKDAWGWKEVHDGPSQRFLASHAMISKLLDMPHTTRRKGSLLIVMPIDLTKKV